MSSSHWERPSRLHAAEKGAKLTRSRGGRVEWTSGTYVRPVTVWCMAADVEIFGSAPLSGLSAAPRETTALWTWLWNVDEDVATPFRSIWGACETGVPVGSRHPRLRSGRGRKGESWGSVPGQFVFLGEPVMDGEHERDGEGDGEGEDGVGSDHGVFLLCGTCPRFRCASVDSAGLRNRARPGLADCLQEMFGAVVAFHGCMDAVERARHVTDCG